MSVDKYRTVRLRRADVDRIEAELKRLGGMYLTDWGHNMSYLTAAEIVEVMGKASDRKLHEWQARDDAGEAPRIRPEELRDDADENRTHEQNAADDADRSDE